jgi:hypothetical protein
MKVRGLNCTVCAIGYCRTGPRFGLRFQRTRAGKFLNLLSTLASHGLTRHEILIGLPFFIMYDQVAVLQTNLIYPHGQGNPRL